MYILYTYVYKYMKPILSHYNPLTIPEMSHQGFPGVTEHRRGVHGDLPHALHGTRDALGVPPSAAVLWLLPYGIPENPQDGAPKIAFS